MSSRFPKYRLDKLAELQKLQAGDAPDSTVFRERLRDSAPDIRTARRQAPPPGDGPQAGEEVQACVTGRVSARRRSGKLTFLDLTDYSGSIQVMATLDGVGESNYEIAKSADLGDILGVRGRLGYSKSGELTIFASQVRVLAKAMQQPPEKHHGLKDPELRARHRTIDLYSNHDVARNFERRVLMMRTIRHYLDDRGFLEVETPMLHPVSGGAAARPFVTHHNTLGLDLYLRIAPELYLKRLLVGGFTRVYEINRNFRNEGISPVHNPEFTMLEVYEVNGDMISMMDLTEGLIRDTARALAAQAASEAEVERAGGPDSRDYLHPDWRGKTYDLESPFQRVAYLDLFREHVGIDPHDSDVVRARAIEHEIEGAAGREHWDLVGELFEHDVEAALEGPIFVYGYPTAISPLAMRNAVDENITDRFELFVGGQELANAFSELNDPIDQRRRLEEQACMRAGTAEGESASVDEDFLLALEQGMPPAGGLGVGIDRLAMLLLGADTIRDVIFFPTVRPKEH